MKKKQLPSHPRLLGTCPVSTPSSLVKTPNGGGGERKIPRALIGKFLSENSSGDDARGGERVDPSRTKDTFNFDDRRKRGGDCFRPDLATPSEGPPTHRDASFQSASDVNEPSFTRRGGGESRPKPRDLLQGKKKN